MHDVFHSQRNLYFLRTVTPAFINFFLEFFVRKMNIYMFKSLTFYKSGKNISHKFESICGIEKITKTKCEFGQNTICIDWTI